MFANARCTGKREALRAKPVNPAGEVSCEGGWDHALVEAIRVLVIIRPAGCVVAAAGWR